MRTRIEGYLKPAKPRYTGHSFLFFDTESHIIKVDEDTYKLPLRLGVAIYHKVDVLGNTKKRMVFKFKTIHEFISIFQSCLRVKEPLYCVAHNIGFDVRVVNAPKKFNELIYYSQPPILNERLFIWKVKTPKGNAIFFDTANYAIESVERLGKDLKFPKLDINLETPNDDELFIYCQRDVEIIERFMIDYSRFLTENNLGRFQLSLASQALVAWKTSLMNGSLWIHNDAKTLMIERESYHGGRVEIFRKIKDKCGRYYNFDVNSLYPYIMENYPVPEKWYRTADNVPIEFFNEFPTTAYYIADVLIETDEPVYSLIYDGKLLFPVGEFRTQLHHNEIMYALEHNHLKKIFHLSIYRGKILFDKYVDFFRTIKLKAEQENNLSWRYIAKIFSNSLYGKFGQQQVTRRLLAKEISDKVWRMPGYDEKTHEYYQTVYWYGELWEETKGGECTHSSPAIAGAITANARLRLWYLINQAGRNNVYYVDTDSLIVNEQGAINLYPYIDATKYGFLKFEGSTNKIDIRGAKDYTFGGSDKVKGVPKKAVMDDAMKWHYDQFQGVKEWLNKGANSEVLVYKRVKERRTKYNKGYEVLNGWINPHSFVYHPVEGNSCITEVSHTD